MTTKLEIVKKKARALGYDDLKESTRKNKKYMIQVIDEDTKKSKYIHFGAKGYKDFLDHGDEKLRKYYRARHSKIKLKNGSPAYKKKNSPAFFSYFLLW